MKQFRMPKKRWLFAAAVVIIPLWYACYPSQYILAFENPDNGELLSFLPVVDGDHFQIKYTHSIHLSDVNEEYVIRDERLFPNRLVYEDTGVGMPANAEAGQTFTMEDGKYILSDLQGSTDKLYLTIGVVRANHQIIFKDTAYSLQDNIGPGKTIAIVSRHVNHWTLWKGEKLHE